jgi:hypothetical protein
MFWDSKTVFAQASFRLARPIPIVISTLAGLRGNSAMRCCDGFFMGNSLSDSKDLLSPFIGTNPEALVPSCPWPARRCLATVSPKAALFASASEMIALCGALPVQFKAELRRTPRHERF